MIKELNTGCLRRVTKPINTLTLTALIVAISSVAAETNQSPSQHQDDDANKNELKSDVNTYYQEWGDYTSGNWKWKVIVIPKETTTEDLTKLARHLFEIYPKTRIRFFDDDSKIQQYINAERYAWDTTGNVPKATFPTEWRKQHLRAIIHDRSAKAPQAWQLIRYNGSDQEPLIFLN